MALKVFYVVCVIYAVLPLGPPLLVAVAALRGWCFATLMYSLGFHLTRSLPQVKGYFYVLVILGLLTALYGIRQTPEEIERKMAEDERFAERYKFTYYAKGEGQRQLRVFSTFISSGAFGSVMAYVIVFGTVLLSDANTTKKERITLSLTLVPMAYALTLSGARSSLLMLAFGFLIVASYRRSLQNFILVPGLVLLALKLAADYTSGASVARFSTLARLDEVWQRAFIPAWIGWNYMQEHLLGGGLGKSGYSVPFFLYGKTGYADFVLADGDLGCLMIEMGIVGLVVFGAVMVCALGTIYSSMKALRDTPLASVASASAACFVMSLSGLPVGSPFLGIPMGAMTWFFLGTLHKLAQLHEKTPLGEVEAPTPPPVAAKRFRYYRPGKNAAGGRPRNHESRFGGP